MLSGLPKMLPPVQKGELMRKDVESSQWGDHRRGGTGLQPRSSAIYVPMGSDIRSNF